MQPHLLQTLISKAISSEAIDWSDTSFLFWEQTWREEIQMLFSWGGSSSPINISVVETIVFLSYEYVILALPDLHANQILLFIHQSIESKW